MMTPEEFYKQEQHVLNEIEKFVLRHRKASQKHSSNIALMAYSLNLTPHHIGSFGDSWDSIEDLVKILQKKAVVHIDHGKAKLYKPRIYKASILPDTQHDECSPDPVVYWNKQRAEMLINRVMSSESVHFKSVDDAKQIISKLFRDAEAIQNKNMIALNQAYHNTTKYPWSPKK